MSEQDAKLQKIDFADYPDTREAVCGVIGLLCYSDTELRTMLGERGIDSDNVGDVIGKVRRFYEVMGAEPPDLEWLRKVRVNIHKNDEKNYVIPLAPQA